MSCVIYLNFLFCCQCKNRYQIANQQKRPEAGLQSSYSKCIKLNCALTSDMRSRFLHGLLNWRNQKGESRKGVKGQLQVREEVLCHREERSLDLHEWGEKTTRDWWMEWCSSCNDIKVSKSSAEGRASNLLLNLRCYVHLRSLQCGWWPERIRSQVQAVEMGFPSRAAGISLSVGVWSLDLRRSAVCLQA